MGIIAERNARKRSRGIDWDERFQVTIMLDGKQYPAFEVNRDYVPCIPQNVGYYCPKCMATWGLVRFGDIPVENHYLKQRLCSKHGDGQLFTDLFSQNLINFVCKDILIREINLVGELDESFETSTLDFGL